MSSGLEGLCIVVSLGCLRLNNKHAPTMRRYYTHAVRQGSCARLRGGITETAEGFPSQRRRKAMLAKRLPLAMASAWAARQG